MAHGSSSSLKSQSPDPSGKRLNTWQAIRADVLGRIRSGEWPPGELIPTEQDLAIEMGCARATVNRALRELASSGIIHRRRKVGTRVASTPSCRTTLSLPVMREEIEALGATYSYLMCEWEMCPGTEAAQKALQVGAQDMLMLVKSRYLANNKAYCCEAIWLNPQAISLPDADVFNTEPPQEWLSRNLPVQQSQFSIMADEAGGVCADSLNLPAGTPVLTIERVNSLDAVPVSFARQFYPPQHRLIFDD
ncbi:MAG: GntR family transcriptional regulator [Paracoccus sp. (in: a-proteobacteria)]|nr:GntR family transcriptional regulator [Paracoccus sp. (in: a-proteobacteria)]